MDLGMYSFSSRVSTESPMTYTTGSSVTIDLWAFRYTGDTLTRTSFLLYTLRPCPSRVSFKVSTCVGRSPVKRPCT